MERVEINDRGDFMCPECGELLDVGADEAEAYTTVDCPKCATVCGIDKTDIDEAMALIREPEE